MKVKAEKPPHRHDKAIEREILDTLETGKAGVFYKDAGGGYVRVTHGEKPMTVHYNGPAKGVMTNLINSGAIAVATTPQAYAGDCTGYRISRKPQMG